MHLSKSSVKVEEDLCIKKAVKADCIVGYI